MPSKKVRSKDSKGRRVLSRKQGDEKTSRWRLQEAVYVNSTSKDQRRGKSMSESTPKSQGKTVPDGSPARMEAGMLVSTFAKLFPVNFKVT